VGSSELLEEVAWVFIDLGNDVAHDHLDCGLVMSSIRLISCWTAAIEEFE
jgi:hypothetical protein